MKPNQFIKTSLFTTLMVCTLQATAQLTPGPGHGGGGQYPGPGYEDQTRIATAQINKNLIHGDTLLVRKLINGLNAGDYVSSIQVQAQALQSGAYLEVIVDQTVTGRLILSKNLSTVSLPIKLVNGVDYTRLTLRSIGKSYVRTLSAVIGEEAEQLPPLPQPPSNPHYPPQNPSYPPQNPNYPPQNPGYPPLTPGYNSLAGFCNDYDQSQFQQAKSFAYSSNGLNYDSNRSVEWALNYNQRHACGTMQEYTARFSALRSLAYSSSGLNMDSNAAIQYASARVETVTSQQAAQMQTTLSAIKSFAYSSNGLNLDNQAAQSIGQQWLDRQCEDQYTIQNIQSRYSQQYSFAYSSSGLNYDSNRAKEYAVNQVRNMTRCGDLLR